MTDPIQKLQLTAKLRLQIENAAPNGNTEIATANEHATSTATEIATVTATSTATAAETQLVTNFNCNS